VAPEEISYRPGQGPEHLDRLDLSFRERHLLPHELDDPVEQAVLALGVVVDRHRIDAQLRAEPAHRERVEALAIDEAERGLQDPSAVEPASNGGLSGGHVSALLRG
jgi:hypothetical protein